MKFRISILLATLFFTIQLVVDGILPKAGLSTHELYSMLAIMPASFWSGEQYLAPLSWFTLHDRWLALFFFLIILSTLGYALEKEVGKLKLVLLLVIPSILSSIPLLFFFKDSYTIVTGSRCMFWSLVSVCLVYYPKGSVKILFFAVPMWMLCISLLGLHALFFISSSLEGGAWITFPGGMLFGILYAWLALRLRCGQSLQKEPAIFYLDVFSKNRKTSSKGFLKELQLQSKDIKTLPSNPGSSNPLETGRPIPKSDFVKAAEDPDMGKPKFIEESSHKAVFSNENPQTASSEAKLFLDPLTGEFIIKDE